MSDLLKIKKLKASSASFLSELDKLTGVAYDRNTDVENTVASIIADVVKRGDEALIEYTGKFDALDVKYTSDLIVSDAELSESYEKISDKQRNALKISYDRIRKYHEHQKINSWSFTDEDGHNLAQKVTALKRVGVYVPGGKASYPSSVLMNCVPALVAGVDEIVMAVPAPGGEINPLVLAAAKICGLTEVVKMGGAQAIAALAYGTETIQPVSKIVGPGNIYVATAKKQVFGKVGIDMIAGPSEILVLCDGKTAPEWVAMDLFSQAEHDEQAQSILISQDEQFLDAVEECILSLLPKMTRRSIIESSLASRGAFILVDSLDEAVPIINRIAPEHLELSVEEPNVLVGKIENAGAIFVGRYTAEAFADYCAGSNHVLPTAGSAKFSSPLSVYDFVKRTSVIELNKNSLGSLAETASVMARSEGLQAHALAAEIRCDDTCLASLKDD